ncbi:angiopoietin-1-like isoform X2 [Homarus americanus]|uniref:angiopoietin-1-like isoform X2 n=1 Tax=Homarus americanus TaxID=6706 RepID=UPI001C46B347|nr:angiopoietin-1-like isoform X2 [Homarus americanus]
MLRFLLVAGFLWSGLVASHIPSHQENTAASNTVSDHRHRRTITHDPTEDKNQLTTPQVLQSLDTLVLSQLKTNTMLQDLSQTFTTHLRDYSAATQEVKSTIEDLTQALFVHLLEHTEAIEDNEHSNTTQDLTQEIEDLEHTVLQQEAQHQMTRQTLEQQEETIQKQQQILDNQEEIIQVKEDSIQKLREESDILGREVDVGKWEKRQVVEELRRMKDEHNEQLEELSTELQRVKVSHESCMSRVQELAETKQEITNLQQFVHSQRDVIRRFQEDILRLTDQKDNLDQQLRECHQDMADNRDCSDNHHHHGRHCTNLTQTDTSSTRRTPAVDCEDFVSRGMNDSGVFLIFPKQSPSGVNVYCEFEGGKAWTVFLARRQHTPQENFTRPWRDYRNGFGNPLGEYWLGINST